MLFVWKQVMEQLFGSNELTYEETRLDVGTASL